jgi:hypothetical protein
VSNGLGGTIEDKAGRWPNEHSETVTKIRCENQEHRNGQNSGEFRILYKKLRENRPWQ